MPRQSAKLPKISFGFWKMSFGKSRMSGMALLLPLSRTLQVNRGKHDETLSRNTRGLLFLIAMLTRYDH